MKCVFPQKLFLYAISLIGSPLKTKMLPFLGCYMKNQKMHVKFFWESNRVLILIFYLFIFFFVFFYFLFF